RRRRRLLPHAARAGRRGGDPDVGVLRRPSPRSSPRALHLLQDRAGHRRRPGTAGRAARGGVTMRVAVVQHDIEWEDPKATFARVEPWIAAAAGAGARLVVLAEMFSTGFSMATERTVEPVDGPSVGFLSEQAARHGLWLCGSVPEQADDAALPSNTFVLAAPDGDLTRYRKLHPFSYAGEHEHFAAGDEVVTL